MLMINDLLFSLLTSVGTRETLQEFSRMQEGYYRRTEIKINIKFNIFTLNNIIKKRLIKT